MPFDDGRHEKGISDLFVVCGSLLELNALVVTSSVGAINHQGQATTSSSSSISSSLPIVPGQQRRGSSSTDVIIEESESPDLLKIRRVEKETVMRFMEAQKGKQIFVKHRHGGGTHKYGGGLAVVEGISPTIMTNTGK